MLSKNRTSKAIVIVTSVAAAYAVYKYATMSAENKQRLTANLRDQVIKIFDQYIPNEIKSIFENKQTGDPAYNAAIKDMSQDDDMRL